MDNDICTDVELNIALSSIIRKKIPESEKELLTLLKQELEPNYNVEIGRVEDEKLGLVLVAWSKKNKKITNATIFKIVYNLSYVVWIDLEQEDNNNEDIERVTYFAKEMRSYMEQNLPRTNNKDANKRFVDSYVFYVSDRGGYIKNMLNSFLQIGLIEDYEKDYCEQLILRSSIRGMDFFSLCYVEAPYFSSYDEKWKIMSMGLQAF